MGISFFALPSKQGSVQDRFKPTHDTAEPFGFEPFGLEPFGFELMAERLMAERLKAEGLVAGLPITLSTKVAACVRRFETPTALNDGRPALALSPSIHNYGNVFIHSGLSAE
jgi:hypothetical protein